MLEYIFMISLHFLYRSNIEYGIPESHDMMPERNGLRSGSEQRSVSQFSHPLMMQGDRAGSFGSEGKILISCEEVAYLLMY